MIAEELQETAMSPDQRKLGKIHPSYLQALAQLHKSWQFGGIAQLVDNSRDAHASRVSISISMPMLKVQDNGKGMNHEELVRMLQFGCKRPAEYDTDQIGFFGLGFKVLEIPIVTYRKVYGIMELDESVQTHEQGETCLEAVKRFSPFNEFEIGSLFDQIGDVSGRGRGNGTSVSIYNLHRWGARITP